MRAQLSSLLLSLCLACAGEGGKNASDEDLDADGVPASLDCDDQDATVFPGADELCDSVDQDCDGEIDEEPVDGTQFFADSDHDGFGDPLAGTMACADTAELSANDLDCNDADAAIFPGAEELCDGIDNDCNGDADSDATDRGTYYLDNDGDGYGDPDEERLSCEATAGLSENNLDCDDNNPRQNPDSIWYPDEDGDGYGNQDAGVVICEQPPGSILIGGDCDDTAEEVNPEVDEVCDAIDNNCDGTVDEDTAIDATSWYTDGDGDGWGDGAVAAVACEAPAGLVEGDGDCDDTDNAVFPWAPEVCGDGIDQDCNGLADNTCLDLVTLSSATMSAVGGTSYAYAGYAVDGGDFDGDGANELVVSAYAGTGATSTSGVVYTVDPAGKTGAVSLSTGAEATLNGEASGDYAGYTLSTMPDVDGDGTDELVVGAYLNDEGASSAGKVYIAYGPLTGTINLADEVAISGELSSGYFGQYVIDAKADLSGDGVVDLVVTAAGSPSASKHTVYVFNGPITADTTTTYANVEVTGSTYGYTAYAATVGDLDGDGVGDLIGAQPGIDAGYVAWMPGPLSTSTTFASADTTLYGETDEDFFGSLLAAGDTDGDGYDDIAVGAKYESTLAIDAGAVYLFPGSATGPDTVAQLKMTSDDSTDHFGHQTDDLNIADINGDGNGDLIIGWSASDDGASNGGAVLFVYGPMGGSLTTAQADVAIRGGSVEGGLGKGATAVDVDGDGAADPWIGAWRDSSNKGTAYLFDGATLF